MMPYTIQQASVPIMPDLADFLTVQEAATALELHPGTVRLFLRFGKFSGIKVGRTWLVSREAVKEYQAQNAGKSKHDPTRINE